LSFVLDNSVALASCSEDEQTPEISALLDRLVETGASAPMLWPLEALNGLLVAERRRRIDATARAEFAAFLRELPVRIDAQTVDQVWGATAALAEQFGLTVYDASYLELAQRWQLPLATLDKQLCVAARALSIGLLGSQQ
jgi:predicted nucleic acid-binding protein